MQLLSCALAVVIILGFAALPTGEREHLFEPGKTSTADTAKCLIEKGKTALNELRRLPGSGLFVTSAGRAEGISCWPCSMDLQLYSMRDKVLLVACWLSSTICDHCMFATNTCHFTPCAILQDGNHYCASCCRAVDACPVKLASKDDVDTCAAVVEWMSAHSDHPTIVSMLDFFKASQGVAFSHKCVAVLTCA